MLKVFIYSVVVACLAVLFSSDVLYPTYPVVDPSRCSALVTGANKGLGLAMARRLAKLGFHVIAGYRSESARESLQKEGFQGARFDVTSTEDMQRVFTEDIASAGRPLCVLVNNAAVWGDFPFELETRLSQIISVNVEAVLRVTQMAIPLLRETPGARIINIGSFLADAPLPKAAIYGGTKAFMRQWGATLRGELFSQRVHVSTIQPGMIHTEMIDQGFQAVENGRQRLLKAQDTDPIKYYAQYYEGNREKDIAGRDMLCGPIAPLEEAVEHAATSPRPRTIYSMSAFGYIMSYLNWYAPEPLSERIRL